jgi:hypothetical protein
MRQRLRTQLADVDDEVWDAGEKDDLLGWAVRRLNQRLNRPIDVEDSEASITLVADTYFYALDTSITHVNRVDMLDSDGNELGAVEGWEILGDLPSGDGKIRVAADIVNQGGSLRLVSFGRYTLPATGASQATAIPDDYVTLVLAMARAEALGRMAVDRAKFRQWQVQNQVQNVSINERIQMVNQAEGVASDEWALLKRWQLPVEARPATAAMGPRPRRRTV